MIEGNRKMPWLPTFLRMALSDALYEAALLKKINIFKEKDGGTPEHDVVSIARLLGISADLFRTLQPGDGLPKEQKARRKRSPLKKLRWDLERLERVPENEGVALQLESEIYRLENEADTDEWPDVIGNANE
jgi:hypothetical protein